MNEHNSYQNSKIKRDSYIFIHLKIFIFNTNIMYIIKKLKELKYIERVKSIFEPSIKFKISYTLFEH